MKKFVFILAALLIILIALSKVAPQPQGQQKGAYVGSLVALVVDCAPDAVDCRPYTEYYLVTDNIMLRLDLSNATIQVPLGEYVGVPDKKVKVIGTLDGDVLRAELVTAP